MREAGAGPGAGARTRARGADRPRAQRRCSSSCCWPRRPGRHGFLIGLLVVVVVASACSRRTAARRPASALLGLEVRLPGRHAVRPARGDHPQRLPLPRLVPGRLRGRRLRDREQQAAPAARRPGGRHVGVPARRSRGAEGRPGEGLERRTRVSSSVDGDSDRRICVTGAEFVHASSCSDRPRRPARVGRGLGGGARARARATGATAPTRSTSSSAPSSSPRAPSRASTTSCGPTPTGALRPGRRRARRGPHVHLQRPPRGRRPDEQLARPRRDAQRAARALRRRDARAHALRRAVLDGPARARRSPTSACS